MNAARLLNTFLDLVRIDSLSLKEKDVAAYCKRALGQAGCTVRFDDSQKRTGSNTGNLIATLPASGATGAAAGVAAASAGKATGAAKAAGAAPALDVPFAPALDAAPASAAPSSAPSTAPSSTCYFSAHMDTVGPGEGIEPVIADGIITSSSNTVLGGDDKVGLAAIIELVRTLAENDEPHPEIGVLFTVAEEIGLRGAHAMDSGGFHGKPCFVLDADGKPGVVIIGAPFHYLFTATFSGRAAHAGIAPEKGVSAIALAAQAVCAMRLGRLDENTTANVGTISGGDAFNVVPSTCVVTGEFRAMDKQRIAEVKAQMTSALEDAVLGTEGSVTIEWEEEYRGFRLSEDDSLVRSVLDAATALGLPAHALLTCGGSDANVFADKGLKPLVLGTGMTDVHGTDESLAVEDMNNLARLCIAIAYAAR
ncbi:MAG: M20/M25/M40 family metallo-hydrolase [Coriobacteriales bacterium]|jgi:tripeptide aminopeptidase|nr:M20/M25/M40 family metallo-hydrolase [Coriobacteriales bacterium]